MFKIPPDLGASKINLTKDYLQEEDEGPTQFEDEEEKQQQFIY